MATIRETISKYQGVTLSQMDRVTLMNRTDKKYWFESESLVEILEELSDHYYILEVCDERILSYETTYFDTADNEMYQNHHRGKKNRFKIRKRNYVATGSGFLEVKFKNNKGRTIKKRQPTQFDEVSFTDKESEFLSKHTPYSGGELRVALRNRFSRLTLVSKAFNERCTIDVDIRFLSGDGEKRLDNLVIVEVKRDGRSPSHIVDALLRHRLKASGFSKYCIGRSFVDGSLKQNNFKQKLRKIRGIYGF